MRRRFGIVVLGLALLGLLGLWWWMSGDPAPEPVATSPTPPTPESTARPRPKRSKPRPPRPRPSDPSALAEAYRIYADALGGNWFQCPATMDFPESIRASNTFLFWAKPMVMGHSKATEGSSLIYETWVRPPDCPMGENFDACAEDQLAYLDRVRTPIANLIWWGGEDGGQAQCRVEAPTRIQLHGRIEGATEGSLLDCNGARLDVEDGTFTLEAVANTTCTLKFANWSGRAERTFSTGDGTETIVLTFEPQSITTDVFGMLRRGLREAKATAESPSHFATVLEDPTLTPEVRSILEGWRDREQAARESQVDNFRRPLELLGSGADLLDDATLTIDEAIDAMEEGEEKDALLDELEDE